MWSRKIVLGALLLAVSVGGIALFPQRGECQFGTDCPIGQRCSGDWGCMQYKCNLSCVKLDRTQFLGICR